MQYVCYVDLCVRRRCAGKHSLFLNLTQNEDEGKEGEHTFGDNGMHLYVQQQGVF